MCLSTFHIGIPARCAIVSGGGLNWASILLLPVHRTCSCKNTDRRFGRRGLGYELWSRLPRDNNGSGRWGASTCGRALIIFHFPAIPLDENVCEIVVPNRRSSFSFARLAFCCRQESLHNWNKVLLQDDGEIVK